MAKIFDDDGKFVGEVCGKCCDNLHDQGDTDEQIVAAIDGQGEDRYSFGVYAGHYCDAHWATSGYKGSTPETEDEVFDPDFAGEVMDEED